MIERLEACKKAIQGISIPEALYLKPGELIKDLPLFIENHIQVIEHNITKPRFEVYLLRLERVIELITHENTSNRPRHQKVWNRTI